MPGEVEAIAKFLFGAIAREAITQQMSDTSANPLPTGSLVD